MPDVNDLLDAARGADRAAADAARLPDYAGVARRGRQLHSRRRFAVVGAAAFAVLAVFGVTQFAGPGPGHGPEPAPAPTPSEIASPSTDADVLAEGSITDVAVTPGSAISRAVVWRDDQRAVVAVTDDGFATRSLHEFDGVWSVESAGDGRFLAISETEPEVFWLLDGAADPVRVAVSIDEYSASDDEILVVSGGGHTLGVAAVDAATAEAHRVPVPAETRQMAFSGGRLMAMAVDTTHERGVRMLYHWSDDGGDTWHTVDTLPIGDVYTPAIGAPPGEHVLVRDRLTTVSHLGGVFRGQGALAEVEYHGDYAVVSDPFVWQGEVRMFAMLSADATGADEAGLYRFVGGRLEGIPTNRPDVIDHPVDGPFPQRLVGSSDGPNGPALWLASPDGALLRSDDGGVTWEETPAR